MLHNVALAFLSLLWLGCSSTPKPPPAPAAAPPQFVTNPKPFTLTGRRAGEGYFSRDGRYVIYQSESQDGNPFYQIYVRDLRTGATKRVSNGQGKTTCAWIHPDNKKVLFASTHQDPRLKEKIAEELKDREQPKHRYSWSFDDTYDIYETGIGGGALKNLTRSPGYDAEGSYSPDGKWIAFASNRRGYTEKLDPETKALFDKDPSVLMDIYIMPARGGGVKRLTTALGYDGGPFFSPDGKRVTFRRFTPDGRAAEIHTIGIDGKDEKQITRMGHMSWAPFYHPSGDYLIFASNREGHANFELFIVDVNGLKDPVRVTFAPGFDGLPVFTPDGQGLLYTHSDPGQQGQLHLADWNDHLARESLGLPLATPSAWHMSPEIRPSDARHWVAYLSRPEFEGRMSGGPKEIQYAQVLADHFKAMGLKPGNGKSYFQEYEFTNGVEIAKGNVLKINGVALSNDDWVPASYSQLGEVADAPVTFAGYGIVAPANENDPAYDSYQGLDVRGKWVLIFDGLPEDVTQTRRFHLHLYSRLQHKALVARERGAKGLILIGDARLRFEGRGENAGLPLVRASSVLADRLLAKTAMNHQGWTNRLAKGGIAGGDVKDTVIGGDIQLKMLKAKTRNVVAKLEAKGAKDTLVLGAHLDHLGRGESGNSLSQIEGAIHHGADDNASGVAAVMEVAHRLGALQAAGDLELKRNIVFGLWTGEEIGILGSTHFVKESKDKLIGYINMDMVGRMRDQTLIVQGLGSAKEWPKLIADMNAGTDALTVKTQADPYLPTDALAFYLKGIPAVSFFTGSHSEYHTQHDTHEKINYGGLARVAGKVAALATQIAGPGDARLTYEKVSGPRPMPEQSPGGARDFRLYLGTIPDYTYEGDPGVKVSGTSKDSPAERAGILAGDRIVELGGTKIRNIHDYVYCLQALKAGEKIRMRVVRDGGEKSLEITPMLKAQR